MYNLLISELYKLIIGDGNYLTLDGDGTSQVALKYWDGSRWNLVYQIKDEGGNPVVAKRFNGTTWDYISVV